MAGSIGGSVAGAGASAIVSTIGSVITSINQAKLQAEMQERIAKLTLEQQERIAETIAKAKTDIEKQKILFQAVALEVNSKTLQGIQEDKTKSVIYLSVGLGILGVVIFLAKRKNG